MRHHHFLLTGKKEEESHPAFLEHDPATWTKPLPQSVRLRLLKLGPKLNVMASYPAVKGKRFLPK